MTRPLRIQFPGALYHITSRGDRREAIYLDDEDRQIWINILASVCERYNWKVHAYCQMTNHYHLLIESIDGNLSNGMRQLNGVYTQRFNVRHKQVGHLFQGRFKAILVQRGSHLLELSRYVVLNPVRAGMVTAADDWAWSSFCAMMNHVQRPPWLDTDWILTQFSTQRNSAQRAYRRFVIEGIGQESPLQLARHQLFLGDERFIKQHQLNFQLEDLTEISKMQRKSLALTLPEYQVNYQDRNEAMARAYQSGAYSMAQIARHFGIHYVTVSRAVKYFENG